jgi:hypothetical protein
VAIVQQVIQTRRIATRYQQSIHLPGTRGRPLRNSSETQRGEPSFLIDLEDRHGVADVRDGSTKDVASIPGRPASHAW